jgi:hypothetical protein
MRKFNRLIVAALAVSFAAACIVGTANAWEQRKVSRLVPGASTSLTLFDTRECDRAGIYTAFGNADSCIWRLFYSQDGTNYTLLDTTIVACSADTSFDAWSENPKTVSWRQLVHTATVGSNNTVHYDGFIYQRLLVTVTNNSVADTAAFQINLICGE